MDFRRLCADSGHPDEPPDAGPHVPVVWEGAARPRLLPDCACILPLTVSSLRERVEEDVRRGRLWKARDRLAGMIRTDPTNQWGLNRLGEIYFRMGDLPAAGRVWFLTDREGPEWDSALAAFYERHGRRAQDIVSELRIRAPIEGFRARAQRRLRALQAELTAGGRKWEPHAGRLEEPRAPMPIRNIVAGIAFILLILLVIVGLITGVSTVFSFLGDRFGTH